jgi:hypothetical protein
MTSEQNRKWRTWTTITTLCSIERFRNFVPPILVFPRKGMKAEHLEVASSSLIAVVSDPRSIYSKRFLHWLQHARDNVRACTENPSLLILDLWCVTYFSLCNRFLHTRMLSLPPHSNPKAQILGPLKIVFYYSEINGRWLTAQVFQLQFIKWILFSLRTMWKQL